MSTPTFSRRPGDAGERIEMSEMFGRNAGVFRAFAVNRQILPCPVECKPPIL
jgi:hypothetical protein